MRYPTMLRKLKGKGKTVKLRHRLKGQRIEAIIKVVIQRLREQSTGRKANLVLYARLYR